MIGSETALSSWLLHCAAGGGLVFFLAISAMRRCGQPALKQRVGEWGMTAGLILAALSLGPAWIVVPLLPIAEKPDSIYAAPPGKR